MNYIEDYLKENMILPIYQYKDGINQDEIPSDINSAITYLRQYANFSYSDNLCQDSPFTRFFTFTDGSGSIQTSELINEHAEQFKKILSLTNHPFIKAKLYDLLGIITKDTSYKKLAAENYKAYILFNLNDSNKHIQLKISLKRVIYLFHKFNKKEEKSFINDIFALLFENPLMAFKLKYISLTTLSEISSPILKEFIPHIETLTSSLDLTIAPVEHYLNLLKILITHYSSTNQKMKYYSVIDRYVLFCVDACKQFSPHGYHYIDDALKLISSDKLKDKYEDKINELHFLKDDEQKKTYKKMTFVESPLDDKIVTEIEAKRNELIQNFKSFKNGAYQLFYLISNFLPLKKNELSTRLESQKGIFSDIANEILYNDDGTIKYESAYATKEEKRQVKVSEILVLDLEVKFDILLSPFIYNIKIDENLNSVVSSICENNLFIPPERRHIVNKIILDGLNKNIRRALYDLIPQFEHGLTCYLKSKGIYPIMYRGSNKVLIDLNHILTSKTKNKFRKEVISIIGEDLTFELEYLLCNKYFGNLRNNNYHSGYDDLTQYTIYEAAAFYFILEAYCLACE